MRRTLWIGGVVLISLVAWIMMPGPNYVTVKLEGQFGNQLFQIATAYAYSLDHNIPLIIPDLARETRFNIRHNAEKIFNEKIAQHALPAMAKKWKQKRFAYKSLPKEKRLELIGYFQSEQYFQHRRLEILNLFSPPLALKEAILHKYPILASDALTVAVQIRDYRHEFPNGDYHPTIGREYYARAMKRFPKEAVFIVSTNNLEFAKHCTQGLSDNIIYLNGQDYLEEFYAMTYCKSFIISNSSFGWWAAWLSTAPHKQVFVPHPWFAAPYDNASMVRDLLPANYQVITYSDSL